MAAYDHSITYRKLTLRNIPHIIRLRGIFNLVRKNKQNGNNLSYLDVGCSNGYITNVLSKELGAKRIKGLDHNVENLDVAKENHAHIDFDFVDPNKVTVPIEKYSFITCFETLEHVGNLPVAVQNLVNYAEENATIVISVPIEIGFFGVIKFLAKTLLFGYKLDEFSTKVRWGSYFQKLMSGQRISTYREARDGWGTHFGFDYRDVDDIVFSLAKDCTLYNSFTTRFYIIKIKK
jgi:2-polyprenyl-3-methyl-5-hydroxy-6-metoxy-1,4-benzoquinol methylase